MVDLDELDRLHAALPELEPQTQDDGWTAVHLAVICEAPMGPGVDLDMYDVATNAVAILNAYPALAAEVRALREVAKKAHELARWDWLPLLVDDPNAADVRDGVAQVRAALAKVPR